MELWYANLDSYSGGYLYQGIFEQYSASGALSSAPDEIDVFTPIAENGQGTLSPI